MKGFYVIGTNIHNSASETYGPFPGEPGMTYEFLRCYSADVEYPDNHIFLFRDVPGLDTTDEDILRDDHWEDEEGALRIDGWRRCTGGPGTFAEPSGAFWTDLSIRWQDNFTPQTAWAQNYHVPTPPHTTRNLVTL